MEKRIEKFIEDNKTNDVAILFASNLKHQYEYLKQVNKSPEWIELHVFGDCDVLEQARQVFGLLSEDVGFDWEAARDMQRDVINAVCM